MKGDKNAEELAVCRRIERVLSEILSDKYDCKVTLRFIPEDAEEGGVPDERANGEEHRALCVNGAGMAGH